MKQKNLVVLAVVTLVVVLAAVVARRDSAPSSAAETAEEPFVEGLLDRINDVARVEIVRGEDAVTVVRRGADWTLEQVGGYPARFETVKETLVAIAELEKAEAKTSDPERYAEIGVQDPGQEGDAEPTKIVLEDDTGAVLASFLAGEQREGRSPRLYVRGTDTAQSWLVKGRLDLQTELTAWMERQILNVPGDRFARMTVERADGETLEVYKESRTEPNVLVADVPEGRELTSPTIANSLSSALSYLSFEEVRPADEVDFEGGLVSTAEMRTWDGLVVVARVAEEGGRKWVRFEASYDDPPQPAPEEPEEEPEGEHAEDDGHDHGAENAEAEELPDRSVVEAEVAELNESLGPWAFVLPAYKGSSFEKRVTDLLRALPEPPPEEGGEEGEEAAEPTTDGAEVEVTAAPEDAPAEDADGETTEADAGPGNADDQ